MPNSLVSVQPRLHGLNLCGQRSWPYRLSWRRSASAVGVRSRVLPKLVALTSITSAASFLGHLWSPALLQRVSQLHGRLMQILQDSLPPQLAYPPDAAAPAPPVAPRLHVPLTPEDGVSLLEHMLTAREEARRLRSQTWQHRLKECRASRVTALRSHNMRVWCRLMKPPPVPLVNMLPGECVSLLGLKWSPALSTK